MARLTNEELESIKSKYNVDTIWSWSRVDNFRTSPYEFYLKYIKHIPEDRQDCIYGATGTLSHDTLDRYYEGKIKYEDMLDEFENGWIMNRDISQLKFDRNDETKDVSIGSKYREDLRHFFTHHIPYKYDLQIEKPIVINVDNNIFVGYIDAIFKDDDNNYHIIDFKSSSIYKGNTLEEHSGQLVLYALGLSQLMSIPLSQIKINFNFLKYCTISYHQKNGAIKTKDVERIKIGESLQSNAKMWLKNNGYSDDETDTYLKQMLDDNSINCLPDTIKNKYKITDCYVYIDLTQELVDKWIKVITTTIKDIETRISDYNKTLSDKCFWDTDESVEKQSYYFATLCGYSAAKHLPYKKYLEKLDNAKKGIDLLSGTGSNSQSTVDNIDLSWLNDL